MHRPTFLILKSMFIDQTHLRRRWCRTCRRRPGTCAAPRWASPSSGRPPSSSTPPLVKACLLGRGWGESNWPTVSQHCQLDCLASEAAPHHSLMPTNAWRPNWISDSIIQTPTLLLPSVLDFIFMVHILEGYSEWAHQCQSRHKSLSLDFCNPFENMSFRFLSYIPTSKIV